MTHRQLFSKGPLLMGAILFDAISRDGVPERYPYSIGEGASHYVRLFLRALSSGPALPREPT